MIVSISRNLWCLSAGKKYQLHPSCFPWDTATILQTCYFGYLGMPIYTQPKLYYQNQFNIHVFLEILQKDPNLVLVLSACLTSHSQNYSIHLYKTLIFTSTPKINFVIHFFLDILHSKEAYSSIGRQHFGP